MRRLVPLLALLAALAAAGCGDDDDAGAPRGSAGDLLQRAFSTPVESGRVALDADLQIDGPEGGDEAYGLELSGPFDSNGPGRLPSADLDVALSGLGPPLSAGLVLTPDNAYLGFAGEHYELGEQIVRGLMRRGEDAAGGRTTLEDFGVDPSRWLRHAELSGEEDVEGTRATRVSGEIDAARVLGDYERLAREYGSALGADPPALDPELRRLLAGSLEESRADVYVAGDGTLRRLVLDLEFRLPSELRERADGIAGGSLELDLTLSAVGEDQRIEEPEDARPIGELLGRFGLGREALQ